MDAWSFENNNIITLGMVGYRFKRLRARQKEINLRLLLMLIKQMND